MRSLRLERMDLSRNKTQSTNGILHFLYEGVTHVNCMVLEEVFEWMDQREVVAALHCGEQLALNQ